MRQNLFAVALLVAVCAAGPAVAQQTSPEGGQPQQQKEAAPQPLTGELVSVEANTRTFVIKTAAEGDVKFSYTETTEIVGADKGKFGLAGNSGTEATVTYESHGTAKVATRIVIKPKR